MSRPGPGKPRAPAATLSNAQLDERLRELQQQAFALFEDAALAADVRSDRGAHARAERTAAPLIEEARALNAERVRRLRARARRWRNAAAGTAIGGGVLVLWLLLHG